MMEWEKQALARVNYDKVFDHVCIMSERRCEEEDIVPPTPEDVDAFDMYNRYLNEVTANTIDSIIDMFEDAGMSYEEACKNFDDNTIDELIDLDSAGF